MTWRKRRQLLYIGAACIVIFAILFYFAYSYVTTPGSCYDNTQDDGELGVDCGGPCARLCLFQTRDPIVQWARALPIASSTYTGVAYISNPQAGVGAAAYGVHYVFRLLNASNQLVIEQNGTVDLPAVQTIPIIAQNITTGSESADHTQFSFTGQDNNPNFNQNGLIWTKIPAADNPTFTVKDQNLAPDGTRLSATIVNETNQPVSNLMVMGVLFDADGNAVAASQSEIQSIDAEGQDTVVFTWPNPNPGVVRAEITPLPSLPSNPQP